MGTAASQVNIHKVRSSFYNAVSHNATLSSTNSITATAHNQSEIGGASFVTCSAVAQRGTGMRFVKNVAVLPSMLRTRDDESCSYVEPIR